MNNSLGCVGCAQANSVAPASGLPVNPFAVGAVAPAAPVTTTSAATPSSGCCGGCAGKGDGLWGDILKALIITLIVGGLLFNARES